MKAAILKAFGSPLEVEEVPPPVIGTGEVLVDVVAAKVLAYAGDVFSGKRQYLLTPPVIPGAGGIGRVAAVGNDAIELRVGDWVLCDPTVRARDNAVTPAIVLQGLTAGDPKSVSLQKYVPNGSWAEQVRVPTENAIPIGSIEPEDAKHWATIGSFMVAYGGFDAVGLTAGETVVLSGATGGFGSAGVAVALALGAGRVIATGRNSEVLEKLRERFGTRVRTVRMTGDEEADRAAIVERAGGLPIDCVLDLLPPRASPSQVRAALMTVRPYGRVVLMGGVREDISLSYSWLMRNCVTVRGQWMYSRASITRAIAMARAGLLPLRDSHITSFTLDQVNDAIAHAAAHAAPFEATILSIRS